MQIFDIAYATVQLQTFPTRRGSTFYLIPSRYLFNRKITFKALGGHGRGRGRGHGRGRGRGHGRRITLALCK